MSDGEEDDHSEVEEEEQEQEEFDDDDEPKKKRKTKAKRDPDRPRAALSAYMCFSKSVRPAILEQQPNTKMTEVAKIIGQKWGELSEADRKPFQALAAKDKERFNKEMASYKPTPGYGDKPAKRGKTSKKDPNAPKRPKSAFFLFNDSRRAAIKEEHPDYRVSDVAKALGEEWKALSDAEKKPFVEQAAALKAAYDVAKEKYNA